MDTPSPMQAAPAGVRRQQAVHDAMASVDGITELPVAEQFQRLDEAQQVLSAVLQKSSDIPQPGIPGVANRP
ncbi:hypothetical protein [Tessaracoccus antarcticus]|uniref:hypothetical protein n=1 Tax=Tessaracoccus antarcticus TaxID=2479848 RepID=UPI001F3E1FBF|nr:hypothetical protein [Tessaracoccus antarcticus]